MKDVDKTAELKREAEKAALRESLENYDLVSLNDTMKALGWSLAVPEAFTLWARQHNVVQFAYYRDVSKGPIADHDGTLWNVVQKSTDEAFDFIVRTERRNRVYYRIGRQIACKDQAILQVHQFMLNRHVPTDVHYLVPKKPEDALSALGFKLVENIANNVGDLQPLWCNGRWQAIEMRAYYPHRPGYVTSYHFADFSGKQAQNNFLEALLDTYKVSPTMHTYAPSAYVHTKPQRKGKQ